MEKNKIFKKLILTLSLIGLFSAPTSFAQDINAYVNLRNEPEIIAEGKKNNEKEIKSSEESILNASISKSAAEFLLENSKETIKNIAGTLKNQVASSNENLIAAKSLLATLKEEGEESDNLADLKESYFQNRVRVASCYMLLNNTPQTIRNVRNKLINLVESAEILLEESEDLINQVELNKKYKIKDMDRKSTGLYFSSPSEIEILNYWRDYQSNANPQREFAGLNLADSNLDTYLSVKPSINDGNPGLPSDEALLDANHVTNTIRYAQGLREVGVDREKSYYAQASSFINYLNGNISHNPALPNSLDKNNPIFRDGSIGASKSNLHMQYGGFSSAIISQISNFIKDDGPNNENEVGHRRWILNPFAQYFGYGAYRGFGSTYVIEEGWPKTSTELVAYPSNVGLSEFFSSSTPFSISFGEAYDISDVTITVTDLKTGRTLAYQTGKNIYTSYKNYGYLNSLSWGLGYSGEAGSQYEINVSGIKLNGVDYPINYTVNFISLENSHN